MFTSHIFWVHFIFIAVWGIEQRQLSDDQALHRQVKPFYKYIYIYIYIHTRWVLLCWNKSWAEWVSHNEWAMWPFVLFCVVFEGTLYCNYSYIPIKLTCHIIYVLYLHDWKSASLLFWSFVEVRMKIFVGGPCPKKGLPGIYRRALGTVYQHK